MSLSYCRGLKSVPLNWELSIINRNWFSSINSLHLELLIDLWLDMVIDLWLIWLLIFGWYVYWSVAGYGYWSGWGVWPFFAHRSRVHGWSLKRTDTLLPASRLLPVMLTTVPPETGPRLGFRWMSLGTWRGQGVKGHDTKRVTAWVWINVTMDDLQ